MVNSSSNIKTYKVIQYATGGVGIQALPAILDNPQLELVGLLVSSEDKVGKDAGEFIDREPTCIIATNKLEDVLALDADCVAHFALFPDIDEICAMLESGKNVVTTAGLLYPKYFGDELVNRLEAACKQGGVSVHGTGINPGFAGEVIPLTLSVLSRNIKYILVEEFADFTTYNSPELNHDVLGFGKTLEQQALNDHPYDLIMRQFFHQSIAMVADGLSVELDDICEHDTYALAPENMQIESGPIAKGTIAGIRRRFKGMLNGEERIVVEITWICGYGLGEGWPSLEDSHNDSEWLVTVEGDPSYRCTLAHANSFEPGASDDERHVEPSMIATAMHAVNAISDVCEARQGIVTFLDLPLLRGRHSIR